MKNATETYKMLLASKHRHVEKLDGLRAVGDSSESANADRAYLEGKIAGLNIAIDILNDKY